MKAKGIAVIGIIVFVILLVIILPRNNEMMAPQIGDSVSPSDKAELEIGTISSDSPEISDSVLVESEENFYIDENGVKHYVIEAKDSPVVGDQ